MSESITFTIDGKQCTASKGETITQAARHNGVFIPTLCDFEGLEPAGTCRICTVRVNGKPMAACTTHVEEGMEIENDTKELTANRLVILEMLFVEGNHFCPACEKSGNCDLQALAYRYRMMAPRFTFFFTPKQLDASNSKLMLERNRCILCKRCVRGIRTEEGKSVFAFNRRGKRIDIVIDQQQGETLSDETAQKAMDICPVGAIIRKEKGFDIPIGKRKYDTQPIGTESENSVSVPNS
jgi:[NiFe] hydrogenase diaphorase moiety small subunit